MPDAELYSIRHIEDRRSVLLRGANKKSKILEIGASYKPTAPKREGWNCFVVDHASRDELVEKYRSPGFDSSVIEEVDFIWNGGSLSECVGTSHQASFDLIIASQVIEHIPNPIAFLLSMQQLLTPNGVIALSVPDKRRCFDFLRPLTTTGDWLQAFHDGRSIHDVKTLYDQAAYIIGSGVAGEAISWGPDKLDRMLFRPGGGVLPGFEYFRLMKNPEFRKNYVDCHAWVFVPSSFQLIMEELHAGGIIDLYATEIVGSKTYEFFVRLNNGRRSNAIDDRERMSLLRQSVQEVVDGYAMMP